MSIIVKLNKETNLPVSKASKNFDNPFYITQDKLKTVGDYTNPYGQLDPFDSINFTNIYTDDLSKYRKYDVPTTRNFNWDEQRAKNQGTGEKWLNGLSKALVTTVGAVAENTLGVVAGIGELFFGSGYYYDNFIGQSIDKANDWMREAMPNYKTQAEIDMPTGQKLGTANFWADTVLNGAGYSLGSIATMFLTGGTGLIARGVNLASKSQKLQSMYQVSKAITTGTQLADKTFKASKAKGLLTAANTVEMGLYMSLAEASVEAREAQKQAYEGLVEKELERLDLTNERDLGKERLAKILESSYAAGNTDFITQLPVLAGTNLFMFGKQVAGFRTAAKINRDVALDAAAGQVINTVGQRGLFRSALSRLKPFAQGSLTEAFQEGWQFASKVGAIDYHTDKYYNSGFEDATESILQGLNETFGTQEGLESMLVGAIVGGGISGVTSAVQRPYAQRKEKAQYLTDLLNGGFLKNAANKGQTANAMTIALQQMEQAREAGDIKKFKDAQNKLITYNAFEVLENGGFDVFMEKLDDAASLEDAEFAKAFGYDPTKSIEEQTSTPSNPAGKSKQDIINGAKKKFKTFKETYDSINEEFPPADRKTGLPRMRMTQEERDAEDTVFNNKENLRAQLILNMSNIKDRNRRLKSISDNMQALLESSVNLNNGAGLNMKYTLALPNYGKESTEDYNASEELGLTAKRLREIDTMLIKNNVDPKILKQFRENAQDYLGLLAQNNKAVEAHIRLSSDNFAQAEFQKEVTKNVAAAKQRAKDSENKKAVEEAKTSKEVKDNVKDPKGEAKVDAQKKYNDLKREEDEATIKYLDKDKGLPVANRLKLLKSIDTSKLSDTERAGLVRAIDRLEEINKKNETTAEEVQEDPDEQSIADILEQEEDVTEQETAPPKRTVILDTDQLEIFDDVSVENDNAETPVLGLELAVDPTMWVSEMKIGVDENGVPDGSTGDTVNDKPILISMDPLLGDVAGLEVEFVIIENDFFVENHKGKPTEIEQIPIYVKAGDTIVGKLQANKSEERKALVQKIRAGQKVTTKIAEVVANNYNNAVLSDAANTKYFFNIKDVIGNGKTENILLAFTAGGTGVSAEPDVVQWQIAQVSEEKNQADLPQIKREAQREQAEGRMDQIAVVVRPENVPGGKARIYILSTANLSPASKLKVLDLIKEKNYDTARQIVATSIVKSSSNPRHLDFSTFENGDKYIVYYSPKLRKLIRINENEMVKALDNNKAFFDLVEVVEAESSTSSFSRYDSRGKRDTESLKFNLAEDFALFLNNKKYHVDKGFANSTEEYTSPTNPSNTYDNYQEYLFSSQEVGDRVEGDGHFSILSIDAVKIGESLFNNPKVTFERGDILGETKQEIVDKEQLKPAASQQSVAPVDPRNPANWKTGDEILITINARRKAQYKVKITKIFDNAVEYTDPDSKKTVQIIVDESGIFEERYDQEYGILRSARLVTTEAPAQQEGIAPQNFKDKFNKKNCK